MHRINKAYLILLLIGLVVGSLLGANHANRWHGELVIAITKLLIVVLSAILLVLLTIIGLIFKRRQKFASWVWRLGLFIAGMAISGWCSYSILSEQLFQQEVVAAQRYCEHIGKLIRADHEKTGSYPEDLSQYDLSTWELPALMQVIDGPYYNTDADNAVCGFFIEPASKSMMWYDIKRDTWSRGSG